MIRTRNSDGESQVESFLDSYTTRVPKKDENKYVIEEYCVDTEFFFDLEKLKELRDNKRPIYERLERISIKTGFSKLYETETSPLVQLFNYVEDRITKGHEENGEMVLTGRDRHLPEEVSKILSYSENLPSHFYGAPSWVQDTDLAHTIASLNYALNISTSLGLEFRLEKIVISAILIHDCAYPKVDSYEKFKSEKVRREHMENAVKEFKLWARKINKDSYRKFHKEYYTPEDIDQICSIVSQHDNPGFKEDFDYSGVDERLFFVHREADRLWMLHPAGFALDLLREIVEKGKYDPQARLEHVISSHQKEADVYKKHKEKCKELEGKKTLYRTDRGFETSNELIEEITEKYPVYHPISNRANYEIKLQNFDCRFCMFYGFEVEDEAETFSCEKEYFNFIEYPRDEEKPAKTIGKTTNKSMHSDNPINLPCAGKDFYFDPSSRWAGLIKGESIT